MLKQWRRSVRALSRRRQNRGQVEQLENRALLSATGSFDDLAVQTGYSDSQIIVQFAPDSGFVEAGELPLQGAKIGRSLGSDGLYRVSLEPGVSPAEAIEQFEGLRDVQFASPDFEVALAQTPDDALFGSLWGLNNTGQSNGTADADIDAAEAWDIRTDSSSIIVGVVDTGIDYLHEDLADNMWVNSGEVPGNGIDDDGNGYVDDVFGYDFINNDSDPMDDNRHGSHVAGTVGAQGNNGVGVAGVAWDASLMALKICNAGGGCSLSAAIEAMNYARNNGAQVTNHSWGGNFTSSALQNAINAFHDAGGITVAAAGNHGSSNDEGNFAPANMDNVIAVAASDRNDNMASFSGFGTRNVEIAAPGVSILSTVPRDGEGVSRYGTLSGTSMASPHVAGAFALLMAEFPNESNDEIIARMMNNTDSDILGPDDTRDGNLQGHRTTFGRLNLDKAIRAEGADSDGPYVTSAEWTGEDGALDQVLVSFSESVSTSTFTTADVTLSGPSGSITVDSVTEVPGSNGTQFEVTFAEQADSGKYTMDIGPDLEDLAGNAMDQDRDGTGGEADEDVFSTNQSIDDVRVFEWSGNQSLRDASTRRRRTRPGSTIIRLNVTEDVEIADLDFELTLNHTWDSDLAIYLYGGRQRVLLFNRRGGDGDNILATFDDEADTAIADGVAPFDGDFRPESSLSTFDGASTQGRWYLRVFDLAAGDTGSVTNFKLIVTPEEDGGTTGIDGDLPQATTPVAPVVFQTTDTEQDEPVWAESETVRVPVSQEIDVVETDELSEEGFDWREQYEGSSTPVASNDLAFATVEAGADSLELFQ